MRVAVNDSVCQGHAMCALACPEVFHTDEVTGHAFVTTAMVSPEHEADVLVARDSCPEEAIQIS